MFRMLLLDVVGGTVLGEAARAGAKAVHKNNRVVDDVGVGVVRLRRACNSSPRISRHEARHTGVVMAVEGVIQASFRVTFVAGTT
jgi:hypothetical protein